jgi:hypothetical protein
MINGRLVMKGRKLLTINEQMVIGKMQEISSRVLQIRAEAEAGR